MSLADDRNGEGRPKLRTHAVPRTLSPVIDLAALDARLESAIADIGPMVVAFSGGVDSSLVVAAARRVLGPDQVVAATADSASLATGEVETCRRLTTDWGVDWIPVSTDELNDPRYLVNEGDRCFWCKSALMDQLEPLAIERNATVVLGVNQDDLGDHRPGQEAARERGARFPLVDAEFSKAEVRALAKSWDLEIWDRPAMPCLSSRVPYGTPITVPLLSRVDRAEAAVRAHGFEDVRVRHYGETARIELPAADLARAAGLAAEIDRDVKAAGYGYVTLDLAGLASGNLNRALADDVLAGGRDAAAD